MDTGIFKTSGYVNHQPQVVFDQRLPHLKIAGIQLFQQSRLLISR